MKKYVIVAVIILVVGTIWFMARTPEKITVPETKITVPENDMSSAAEITCTYSQTLNANYRNGEIAHSLPNPELKPLIFTFTNVDDPKAGQLSSLDATQTITTSEIIKLIEDEDKIIYVDGIGQAYLTIHTIYKKFGVATYVKNVNFFGILPSMTSAMGSCIGY